MRRFVSIVLVVLCLMGPACALLPGSDEAQLPACCRRHGAHHCMMAMAARTFGPGHIVSAPAHCPLYHRALPAATAPFALPASPPAARAPESRMQVAASRRSAHYQARTSANRGPPASL